jgi:hypothetical protein
LQLGIHPWIFREGGGGRGGGGRDRGVRHWRRVVAVDHLHDHVFVET